MYTLTTSFDINLSHCYKLHLHSQFIITYHIKTRDLNKQYHYELIIVTENTSYSLYCIFIVNVIQITVYLKM